MPDGKEQKIMAILLVGALFYVVVFKEGATGSFMNLMFVVVGYYFGNGQAQRNNGS